MKKKSSKKIKAVIVVGARPNFMKAAPVLRAMKKAGNFEAILVHTGQHYDSIMSDVFFRDLDMPRPDIFLGVGSGTHAEQTAKVMLALEPHLQRISPDAVIVVGDVNSTLAAALAARKMNIPVAHIESGLRSFDDSMPEEINRILTDRISDFLFTTEPSANANLAREGHDARKIYFSGNCMIDTLLSMRKRIALSPVLSRLGLMKKQYVVLTLHRPSNVDSVDDLRKILKTLSVTPSGMPIVFPVHPRTKERLKLLEADMKSEAFGLLVPIEPLGYIDFMRLVSEAAFVLTDSGGIQEETTVLGVPCVTLRDNTERPITVTAGTNILAGTDSKNITRAIQVAARKKRISRRPKHWDGKAARRIVKVLSKKLG